MFDKSYSGDVAIAASQSVKEREYWLEKLSGEPVKSFFPYDNNEPEFTFANKDQVGLRFSKEIFSRLTWISNQSDARLLTVLAAGLIVLVNKYTTNQDITIGMPIYKQEVQGDFINTVVALRCQVQQEMTFKDMLYQIKRTIDEAVKHQNYPIKTLLYDLQLPFSERDFPLFDIVLLLKNIQDPGYVHIPVNMEFHFQRTPEYLEVEVRYNRSLYDRETVERIGGHFSQLLQAAIFNVDITLAGIEILTGMEKKTILEEFNRTGAGFQDHITKTIHQLFEEQVEKTPDGAALVFVRQGHEPEALTYRQFNEKSRQLAGLLKEKGIGPGSIVALLLESSIYMATSVLAVLKVGGAYLPIDMEAPEERKTYILKDSGVRLMLTGAASDTVVFPVVEDIELLDVSDERLYAPDAQMKPYDFEKGAGSVGGPAYIIYTSGSTGRPKGVIVEHGHAVNTLGCRKDEYHMTAEHTALQLFSYAFDGFITSFFTPIISGARLILLSKDTIQDISRIIEVIVAYKVTHFISVPVLFQALIAGMTVEEAGSLQVVTLAGDKVQSRLVEMAAAKNKNLEIVNEYGVTEAAVMSTIHRRQERDRRIKIGHPIANTSIYIINGGDQQNLAPIGVFGEMCIAGAGVTRGYLNNPELTVEKFVQLDRSYRSRWTYLLYKTGDRSRWLTDGNIEYEGRMDFQVKVRGFRIELGEIERHLLAHTDIKEAIVTAVENDEGDKNLCAYIVAGRQLSVSEIREYLAGRVPEYMIPAYFVLLEGLPLSPNGKIDRKQLPPPSMAMAAGEYIAPRNGLERQLVDIWAEILGVEKDSISIDANFFELGGHSLKATILLNRIIKEFNARIAMIEIFKSPTIRALAEEIKAAVKESYEAIEPVPEMDYYDVSHAQKRLWVLEHFAGGLSAYNIADWFIFDNLNQDAFEKALETMVKRHESFRTTFITVDGEPKQKINDYGRCGFKIEYIDLRQDQEREKVIAKVLAEEANAPFNLELGPLLRVKFLYLPGNRTLFVVAMHHIISDGWSLQVLKSELLTLYNAYCHQKENPLPPLRIQYKDFTAWQNKQLQGEALAAHQKYWRECFRNEIPLLDLETDFPRPAVKSYNGSDVKFNLDLETYHGLTHINNLHNTTFLMTLTALLIVLLHRLTGQEDIVIGLPVSGRDHADLENQVGFYVNTLPIRVRFKTDDTFENLLNTVKEIVLSAFEHQVYPFDRMVEDLGFDRDKSRSPLFDVVLQYLNFEGIGEEVEIEADGTKEEIRSVLPESSNLSMEITTSKFDLVFNFSESKTLDGNIIYNTDLFEKQSIVIMIERLKAVLREIVANPKISLAQVDIEIGFEKEMKAAVNSPDFDFE